MKNHHPWTVADQNLLKEMYDAGKAYSEMSEKLGRSTTTIYDMIRRLKLPRRPQRENWTEKRRERFDSAVKPTTLTIQPLVGLALVKRTREDEAREIVNDLVQAENEYDRLVLELKAALHVVDDIRKDLSKSNELISHLNKQLDKLVKEQEREDRINQIERAS